MGDITIPGRGTAQSVFEFNSSAAGTYSVVNVNVNYSNKEMLICDKIELISGQEYPPLPPSGEFVTLIDFGKTESDSTFGLSGWNTVIKDIYTDYRDIGPGGTTSLVEGSVKHDFQGVKGTAREFVSGEQVAVTWYNNSGNSVTFTPEICFNDENRQGSRLSAHWAHGMKWVT